MNRQLKLLEYMIRILNRIRLDLNKFKSFVSSINPHQIPKFRVIQSSFMIRISILIIYTNTSLQEDYYPSLQVLPPTGHHYNLYIS
jgi:hypothetical protein